MQCSAVFRMGTILASGSATGSAHFYDYHTARMLHTLHAHSQLLSVCSEDPYPAAGYSDQYEIKIWN
ncbi:WD repeat-containing protein 25 [Lates japonicus]|uniref:WD repeat-containing protein 25 n=1 Tax=Lates japonicus TaxID=270547 RepID=A0AAD3NLV1_LATJO|nr:WD repeat-containing protein 25 [Lates japonicus]